MEVARSARSAGGGRGCGVGPSAVAGVVVAAVGVLLARFGAAARRVVNVPQRFGGRRRRGSRETGGAGCSSLLRLPLLSLLVLLDSDHIVVQRLGKGVNDAAALQLPRKQQPPFLLLLALGRAEDYLGVGGRGVR